VAKIEPSCELWTRKKQVQFHHPMPTVFSDELIRTCPEGL
jgi:hypothetical protein